MPGLEPMLTALPMSKRLAFAAACGERILNEVANLGEEIPGEEPVRRGIDFGWRAAGGETIDRAEAEAIYENVRNAIPITEDSSEFEMACAGAGGIPALMALEPDDSASHAASVAEQMVGLVGLYYEDSRRVELEEERWQRTLIERLESAPGRVTREVVNTVPDYDRGERVE